VAVSIPAKNKCVHNFIGDPEYNDVYHRDNQEIHIEREAHMVVMNKWNNYSNNVYNPE
jgi:hypothetical protein